MSLIGQIIRHGFKKSESSAHGEPVSQAQLISADYARLNASLHKTNSSYGTSGKQWAKLVRNLAAQCDTKEVLDYGCGKQTLATSLPDLDVRGYDPAIPGMDAPPSAADIVTCTDVLEHVEPECIDQVLDDLQRLTRMVAFVTVATRPAVKVLADGRNAHLTVQPFEWWKNRFSARFTIKEVKEIEGHEFALVLCQADLPLDLTPVLSQGQAKKSVTAPTSTPTINQFQYKGQVLTYNTPNEMTAWRVQSLLQKEPDTICWLESIPSNAVLVDIGANVGMYSIFAAVIRKARVYAFEPESQNFALLNANIFSNQLSERVVAYPLALSNQNEAARLHLSSFSAGGSCHSFGEEIDHNLKPRTSPLSQGSYAVSLDHLIETGVIPQPEYIKIDVDGLEHKVIEGAAKALRSPALRSVIIELNTALVEHQGIVETMQSAGFKYDPDQADGALRKDGTFKGVGEFIFFRDSAQSSTDGLLERVSTVHLPVGSEQRRVLSHVAGRIRDAKLEQTPFPYLVVDDILPPDYFLKARGAFPHTSQMTPIGEAGNRVGSKSAYKERNVTLFTQEAMARLTAEQRAFWLSYAEWLYSDAFVNLMIDKFADALEPRLANILGKESKLRIKGDALLVNDATNYAIGPHTDAPHRLISFLFYMPEDTSMREFGTSLYTPKDPDFICWGGPHHDVVKFDLFKTIDFLPNRLLCFPKTERSFHGVERILKEDVSRRLLINNIRILNRTNTA